MNVVGELVAAVALIVANGYFVAAEFAYVAAPRGELEVLAAAGGTRAQQARQLLARLPFVLSGAQLGITATSLVLGFIAERAFGEILLPLVRLTGLPPDAARGLSFTAGLALATTAQMIIGELAPKNLAIARARSFALALAPLTVAYTKLAGPVIWLFDSAANRLLRAAGLDGAEEREAPSVEELAMIIERSTAQGTLPRRQAALLARALEFRALRAADVMVPRPQVEFLPANATCDELRSAAMRTGHSRFPITGERGLDDVLGVVQVKDLLRVPSGLRGTTPVKRLVTDALAVPESSLLAPLLTVMRSRRSPMAMVLDEYGGTAGVVTLEDILEELVGEIEDEHDHAGPSVRRLPDGSLLVPGAWRLDEVRRETGHQLPPGQYDTVGGLVMALLERVARPGDTVRIDGVVLRVQAMDGMAISWLRLWRDRPPEPATADRTREEER